MKIDFGANKTPVEVTKEGTLEELFLETFILVLMVNVTESHGKNLDELGGIDQKCYCSNCYDVSVNKHDVKCRTPLRFWEND